MYFKKWKPLCSFVKNLHIVHALGRTLVLDSEACYLESGNGSLVCPPRNAHRVRNIGRAKVDIFIRGLVKYIFQYSQYRLRADVVIYMFKKEKEKKTCLKSLVCLLCPCLFN